MTVALQGVVSANWACWAFSVFTVYSMCVCVQRICHQLRVLGTRTRMGRQPQALWLTEVLCKDCPLDPDGVPCLWLMTNGMGLRSLV